MAVTHNTAATAEQTSMAPRCPLGYLTASHANLVVAKLGLIEVGWGLGSTNSTPDLIHLVAHMLSSPAEPSSGGAVQRWYTCCRGTSALGMQQCALGSDASVELL